MTSLWDLLSAPGANYGTLSPQELPANPPTILDSIIAGLGKTAANAAMAPGNAYKYGGTVDEMIKPAADLAMMTTLGAGAMPAEADALRMGIRAYHGSPYDFNKFDLSKIGMGEGAQAYGHGLYFAENPAVAEQYKRALTGLNPNSLGSGKAQFGVNGVPMPSGISGHAALDTGQQMDLLLSTMKHNPDSTMIPFLRQQIENRIANHYSMTSGGSAGEDMRAMADYYNKHVKNATPEQVSSIAPGRMYEVNINAEPQQFLDWEKPIGEQPQAVKDIAQQIGLPAEYSFPKLSNRIGEPPLPATKENYGSDFYRRLGAKIIADKTRTPEIANPVSVGDIIDPFASKALSDAGIPGIKYLDQGSRGSATGTRNYVVFNPDIIDIIRKYGLAGLFPAAGALAPPRQQAPILSQ